MVNNLLYCWKTWEKKDGWDGMVHCSEKQYQHFVETQEMQQLLTSGESILERAADSAFCFRQKRYCIPYDRQRTVFRKYCIPGH